MTMTHTQLLARAALHRLRANVGRAKKKPIQAANDDREADRLEVLAKKRGA